MAKQFFEKIKAPLRPIRHGATAIGRIYLLDQNFAHLDAPKKLVISTGGAGTTFLMKHLGKFVQINDSYDKDRLKHLHRLPEGWQEKRLVLYIYGDPADVFVSIKRRKWLHKHAGELGCFFCQFTFGNLRQKLFERAVQNQIDTYKSYRSDNVMLLAYDDIWTRVEEIAAFFEINDRRFVQDFPVRRPRHAERPDQA